MWGMGMEPPPAENWEERGLEAAVREGKQKGNTALAEIRRGHSWRVGSPASVVVQRVGRSQWNFRGQFSADSKEIALTLTKLRRAEPGGMGNTELDKWGLSGQHRVPVAPILGLLLAALAPLRPQMAERRPNQVSVGAV